MAMDMAMVTDMDMVMDMAKLQEALLASSRAPIVLAIIASVNMGGHIAMANMEATVKTYICSNYFETLLEVLSRGLYWLLTRET